uniref:Zinc finger protein 782 n=1 Tax=Cacopsylla melanoneura TaxID=428564 RepID=A0A8D8V9P2_9HEMI
MEKNETEADVEKQERKENEISRKRKRETKVKHEEKRTKKSEKVTSKLVDLFQQPFVIDHLIKYVERSMLIPDVVMESSTQPGNKNETMVSSKCVCRLCTKSDKTIYLKLFHADKTMTPIANKIAYLMGEHKIEQDLLPQQICLGCSEMVDSSYEALRQFSKSYQILSDVVTELRNRTQLFFFKNGPKKVALYLKISDKDYEFSSNLQTTTGLEGSTKRSTIAKCFVCLENFDSGDSLKAHTSQVHSCKIEYKCASCNITFPTFTDLRAHMKISTVCNLKHKDTELEHETRNKQNVDLPLSENDNTNNFVDETDSNDHYVNEDDNTDDCTKSENSDRISEIDIDEDSIVPNEDDADPIACTLLKRKRKKQIVLQYYIKILKKGPVESRSCNYCDQIFKLTHSDEYIKAHILTHSLSHDKESMDINTLDIGQHAGTTPCYMCSLCKIPKPTPDAIKKHLGFNCSVLRKKYNLKARRGDNPNCYQRQSKIYYCKTCNDNTPYKNKEFKLHMKENHPELVQEKLSNVCKSQNIIHNCKTCNDGTSYEVHELKLHMKENHPELLQEKLSNVSKCQNILHKCKTCNDGTPYKMKQLKLHVKEKHPELVLNCAYCKLFFIEKPLLLTHIKMAHLKNKEAKEGNDEKAPLLCEFCSLECKSKQGYLNHMKTHLNPNAKPKKQRKIRQRFQLRERDQKRPRHGFEWLHCHVCNKMLQFKEGPAALEFHIQRHNYPDNKVECCNRKYDIYIKYQKHLRSHSKNWPCKICDVPCSSMVQLQDHLTQHHSKRCEECGHEAKTFRGIIKHIEKHKNPAEKISSVPSGVKFRCAICNLLFDTKHALKAHRNQLHWEECKPKEIPDLPEPITCCGKKFLKRENLKKHTAKHIETPCKKCGAVLMSKLDLLTHNASHHSQGRECQYCSKIYTNSDSLKYHMLKHTHGRQFKCLCGLAYYTESDLRKHQKTRKIPCIGRKMLQDRQSDVETVEVMPWNMEL